MSFIPQIIFVLVAGALGYVLFKRISRIAANIRMGRDVQRSGDTSARLKNMLLVAFGQQKMFKKPLPAFFHLLIYVGFLLINLEVLEIVLDGVLGTHRLFAPIMGGALYGGFITFFEVLVLLVMLACVVFLYRRNVSKVKRFSGVEMSKWPTLDANLILVIELVLMVAILTMNATDQVLQGRDAGYTQTASFFFSAQLMPLFEGMSTSGLIILERAAWWFHIVGILAFAVYVTYSKHLHIFLAFPNTYYANLESKGKMDNMPAVTNEVYMMLGLPNPDSNASAAAPADGEIPRLAPKISMTYIGKT